MHPYYNGPTPYPSHPQSQQQQHAQDPMQRQNLQSQAPLNPYSQPTGNPYAQPPSSMLHQTSTSLPHPQGGLEGEFFLNPTAQLGMHLGSQALNVGQDYVHKNVLGPNLSIIA